MSKRKSIFFIIISLIFGFTLGVYTEYKVLKEDFAFDCINSIVEDNPPYEKKKECSQGYSDRGLVQLMSLFHLNLAVAHNDEQAIGFLYGRKEFADIYPILLDKCFKKSSEKCIMLRLLDNAEKTKPAQVLSNDLIFILEKKPQYKFREYSYEYESITKIFKDNPKLCEERVLMEKINFNISLKTVKLCNNP